MSWPTNHNLIPATFHTDRARKQAAAIAERPKRTTTFGQYLDAKVHLGAGPSRSLGIAGTGTSSARRERVARLGEGQSQGLVLDVGIEGGGRLVERSSGPGSGRRARGSMMRWEWEWVRGNDQAAKLTMDTTYTFLFPPTIQPSPIRSPTNLFGSSQSQNPLRRRTRSMTAPLPPSLPGPNGLSSKISGLGPRLGDDLLLDEDVRAVFRVESVDGHRGHKARRRSALHRSASSDPALASRIQDSATESGSGASTPIRPSTSSPSLHTSLPPTRSRVLVEHHNEMQEKEKKRLEEGNGGKIVAIRWGTRAERGAGVDREREQDQRLALAFPMGLNGEDLNISPFIAKQSRAAPSRGDNSASASAMIFTPTHEPCFSFPTPILQISGSDAAVGRSNHPSRARSTNPRNPVAPFIRAKEYDNITLDRTGGDAHVDVAMHPFKHGMAVMVDRAGRIWVWSKGAMKGPDGGKLSCVRTAYETPSDGFWRVAWGTADRTVLAAGSTFVDVFNLQKGGQAATRRILDLSTSQSTIISLDPHSLLRSARYTCVTTSKSVTWIDEEGRRNPALSWVHHRMNVPDLRAVSMSVVDGSATLLLAPPWSAITCFTTHEDGGAIRSAVDPYYLPISPDAAAAHNIDSALVVDVPGWHEGQRLFLIYGRDGSLQGSLMKGAARTAGAETIAPKLAVRWSDQVEVLAQSVSTALVTDDIGEMANFRSLWTDLQWAVYGVKERTLDVEELRDLLLEGEDMPSTGPTTMLEIVSSVCDHPEHKDRGGSAFLRGFSFKDADTSFGAMTEAISSIDRVIDRVPIESYDITGAVEALCPVALAGLGGDGVGGRGTFRSGLTREKDVIARRLVDVRTAYARRRLELDLRLSSKVLGGAVNAEEVHALPRVDSTQDLAAIAARLQIDGVGSESPPDFRFELLHPRPVWKGAAKGSAHTGTPTEVVLDRHAGSGTIRALLGGWTVGVDPSDVLWESSRPVAEGKGDEQRIEFVSASRGTRPGPARATHEHRQAQSQPIQTRRPPTIGSQPIRSSHLPQASMIAGTAQRRRSPERASFPTDVANTQSVPGRFGSRLGGQGRMGPGGSASQGGQGRKRAFGF